MLFSNKNDYDSSSDTLTHQKRVEHFINIIMCELAERCRCHDDSKLKYPEKEIFDKYTPKLKNLPYGSTEYYDTLKNMKVALDHHYENNRHHPEHFEDGIQDMTLVDLIEMFCDWTASCERTENGNIFESINTNQSRFNFSDDLKRIFINTASELF